MCKTFELYGHVVGYAHRQWGRKAPWPDMAPIFAHGFDWDNDLRLSINETNALVRNLTL